MANLAPELKALQQERTRLAAQLDGINGALDALNVSRSSKHKGRTSAEGIARIRAAQKVRWAKWRKAKKK